MLLTTLAVTLPGCGAGGARPLANVNKVPITLADVRLADAVASLVRHRPPPPEAAGPDRITLAQLVDEETVLLWARRQHLPAPAPRSVAAHAAALESTYGDVRQWRAALARRGLTTSSVRGQIRRALVLAEAFRRITARVPPPSPGRVAAYYTAHRGLFMTPRSVLARQIVVAGSAAAHGLLAAIRHGASFAALARRDSRDRASAAAGGSLGYVLLVPDSSLPGPVYRLLARLRPGAYGIARTRLGYHIVEVQGERPGRVIPLSKVAGAVRAALWTRTKNAVFQQFVKRLRSQARIMWAPNDGGAA